MSTAVHGKTSLTEMLLADGAAPGKSGDDSHDKTNTVDFGATLMVAGNIPGRTQTAAIAIYDAVESGNTLVARTLVIVISVLTASIVFFANRLEQRRSAAV